MSFPQAVLDAWHLVALSRDMPRGKARKVMCCDTPIALFRTDEGVGALVDRCPHRNYPLSEGRVMKGTLECPYHGWRFARDGRCAEVPGCQVETACDARLAATPLRVLERRDFCRALGCRAR